MNLKYEEYFREKYGMFFVDSIRGIVHVFLEEMYITKLLMSVSRGR